MLRSSDTSCVFIIRFIAILKISDEEVYNLDYWSGGRKDCHEENNFTDY